MSSADIKVIGHNYLFELLLLIELALYSYIHKVFLFSIIIITIEEMTMMNF